MRANNSLFKNSFFIAVSIYILSALIGLFLPTSTISKIKQPVINFKYNYSLSNIFQDQKTKQPKNIDLKKLNFILIAVYVDAKNSVAVVEKNNKTDVLSIGDIFDGYKFVEATSYQAIFEKNGKKYKIELKNSKLSKLQQDRIQSKQTNTDTKTKDIEYNDIDYYQKNQDKIWQEISIYKIDGNYQIQRIKKGSKMEKLGLKSGDIIKSVNGKEVKKDSDAIKLYQEVNKQEFVTLTILRDGEMFDIEYNIKR